MANLFLIVIYEYELKKEFVTTEVPYTIGISDILTTNEKNPPSSIKCYLFVTFIFIIINKFIFLFGCDAPTIRFDALTRPSPRLADFDLHICFMVFKYLIIYIYNFSIH